MSEITLEKALERVRAKLTALEGTPLWRGNEPSGMIPIAERSFYWDFTGANNAMKDMATALIMQKMPREVLEGLSREELAQVRRVVRRLLPPAISVDLEAGEDITAGSFVSIDNGKAFTMKHIIKPPAHLMCKYFTDV